MYKEKKPQFILLVALLASIFLFNFAKVYSQTLLKGGIRTRVQKGQVLKVTLGTPINFYFSQIGDKVASFTKEDISVGDGLIPKGSRIEGKITQINTPEHFGQDGSFEIEFLEIVTPNGKSIPVYASASTDSSKIEEKVADILSYDAALIAYGTFNGLLGSLQYGGLPLAIGSHGISLLAGAGIGAGAGTIGSIVRKGKIPTPIAGIPTEVKLNSDFYVFGELPKEGMGEEGKRGKGEEKKTEYKGFRFFPAVKKNEIELVVNEIEKKYSKTYGDYIVLKINIKNNSKKIISLSDVVLISDLEPGPLHPDLILSGTEALKSIKSSNEIDTFLAFLITGKLENYSISILDPLDGGEIVKVLLRK